MISYRRSNVIRSTLLNRADIEQLARIFLEEFSNSTMGDSVEFSSTRGSATIKEVDLTKLISQLEGNDFVGFSINAFGWNANRKIERSAGLQQFGSFVDISVSGLNESWVIGFTEKIRDFLYSKKSLLWILNTPAGYILDGIFYTTQMAVGGYIAFQSFYWLFLNKEFEVNLYIVVLFVFSIALTYLKSKMKFVQFSLKNRPSFRENYEMPLFILFGIATVLQAILSIVSYLGD